MSIYENLETLKNPSRSDFFILDIDSTLVTTHQRNQAILLAWIKANRDRYQEDCVQLAQAQCQFGDYGLKHALERIQFAEKNPGSSEALNDFWRQHFFSNTYLHADVATRGAVDWTQNLEELGVEFVYLTARHKATMWEGTLTSLDNMGFPISENNLFLKENLSLTDEDYKAQVLSEIIEGRDHQSLWFIDNEPVVLNRVHQEFPRVNLIWFDSTHSGKMQAPPGIASISSFSFS